MNCNLFLTLRLPLIIMLASMMAACHNDPGNSSDKTDSLSGTANTWVQPENALSTFESEDSSVLLWPKGKQAAISLSFDDARESQVIAGTDLLDQYGIKATFFVVPSSVEKQLDGWKKAVASGHEIGNHSLTHPCTVNFPFYRKNGLEDYTLNKMQNELTECNKRIKELLNIKAEV